MKMVNIELATILSSRTKEGMVELTVNSERVQMDVRKAKEVLGMLTEAIEAAISDELIFKFLVNKVGIEEGKAAAALLDFREMRQGTKEVVRPQ